MTQREWLVVSSGFAFPECPVWHDGKLWFSDVAAGEVVRLDLADGSSEVVMSGLSHNAGLGFLPNGDLLVAEGATRRVLRRAADGSVSLHADLSGVATHTLNDMHVDPQGRAYVGNYGDDSVPPAPPFPAALALVQPDGTVSVAAPGLAFPNGVDSDPSRAVLHVAETRSAPSRLTTFDVADDGSLHSPRTLVEFAQDTLADGIAVAPDGSIWVASPFTDEIIHVGANGSILEVIEVPHPYAVAVAGDDLVVCSAPTWVPTEALELREGKILSRKTTVSPATTCNPSRPPSA